MNPEPNDERRIALLEEKVDELHDRLQTIETWSVAMYQYESRTRPNRAVSPPAPLWRQRATNAWSAGSRQQAASSPRPASGYPAAASTQQWIVDTQSSVPVGIPSPQSSPPAVPQWSPPPGQPAPAYGSPAAPPPFSAPPRPQRQWSFSDFEQLLSGRGLAWIGGLAILLGALFFLGLAFTRGWIGPAGRVGIGMVAGIALVAGGAWFFERREALFGHVLLAVGLGTTSLALVAATRLYDLFPAGVGLIGALVVAVAAAVVAIRANAQVVAGYGLVTALLAPPLLGAHANLTTIAFLAAALIGTTAIALYRTWNWLPTVAFLLSAPQLFSWLLIDRAPLATGLIALAAFWALNTLAAGGEEFRLRRDRLSVTSTTLLLATAAFLVSVGFAFLDDHHAGRAHGLFMLITACAYGAVGAYFLRDRGASHPFGLLATGTGIAALTMAVPIQFGAHVVPIAWAAEAAALAWVYGRRQHRFSGFAALALGALALLHLLADEYPLENLFDGARYYTTTVPFAHAAGGALGFALLALVVAGIFVRDRLVRSVLTTVGYGLVLYALPFEVREMHLLIGWAALFVLGFAVERVAPLVMARFPQIAATADETADDTAGSMAFIPILRWARVGITAIAAIVYAFVFAFPNPLVLPRTPFTDQATRATAILIAAGLLAALLTTERLARRIAIIAPFGFAAFLLPYELRPAATVVGWAALAIALCLLARRDRGGMFGYLGGAATLVTIGFFAALTVAPPSRLAVHGAVTLDHPLFLSGATAALGALAVALVFGAWSYRKAVPWLLAAAVALAVYLLSIGIVDEFQRHVSIGTPRASLVALQKQAQVALSIFWATLGGVFFVVGIIRRLTALRIGGLALLGIATVKVFLFDLASLDATYRVPSLIGLGVLLLASSYVYQRLRPREQMVS